MECQRRNGYEDDGAKVGTRRESWSGTIPTTPRTGESGVDKRCNQGTDIEQHIASRTSGKEDEICDTALSEFEMLEFRTTVMVPPSLLPTTDVTKEKATIWKAVGESDPKGLVAAKLLQGQVEFSC
ncbi:hypothetical protein K435DRAFT_139336 [Dendrothele bispora CBS 962.96]|uniref:Uncharacterized protein n=1 Tax=Dendrothele bispora (strain CBS 962.96) TaxID=1314807 RepID=A0A4S8LZL9_DENBC|nr:hypothetical protein K435DRAFT_139336 [Dendrothele bispora CBS 962.96]